MTETAPQHMIALGRANLVRLYRAQVKMEIGSVSAPEGVAMIADILTGEIDARLVRMPIGELIAAVHRFGPTRARQLVMEAEMPTNPGVMKPIGSLTARQRAAIVAVLRSRT